MYHLFNNYGGKDMMYRTELLEEITIENATVKINAKIEEMEKETTGTVISVTKQWWLKVNRKPVRTHAMDGAAFPHIIKVKYTIGVKDYTCQKWIGAGNKIPDKGTTIKVIYCEDKPSKARIEL